MIGKRVQHMRLSKGLSLTQLAERAGVAKSYLSAIERDIQSNPSIRFLEKIAVVLHSSVDELLHEDKEQADSTLDNEWTDIVKEAMKSGVSKEEFLEFLDFYKWKSDRPKS